MPSPDRKLPDGAPIAADEDGTPIAFPVLGITLHLDTPVEDDGPVWEQVASGLASWMGPFLSFTSTSSFAPAVRYRPGDLDAIATFPSMLRPPPSFGDPEADDAAAGLHATSRDDFAVMCHGGAASNDASAYGVRFFAELDAVRAGEPLRPCAALRVTVPLAWPLDDFRARAIALASALRIRWGVAGLTYAGWEPDAWPEVRAAVYAHARRYPGFDVAELMPFLPVWHDAIRTVSWLTFVGEPMIERLGGPPRAAQGIAIEQAGAAVMIQAGAAPEPGDTNRLQIPAALRTVDAMLRTLRPAQDLHFGDPWTETTTRDWIDRFERKELG